MARKIPLRKCIVTGELLPKQELLRIVRTPESEIKIDLTGRLNGRGAYLKKDIEVVKTARSKKMLNRALGVDIDDRVYDEILNTIAQS